MTPTCTLLISVLISIAATLGAQGPSPQSSPKGKAGRVATPAPTHPPLEPADITTLPEGAGQLDLYLLMGQSNMKGRGIMPDEPKRDPRIVLMHLKDDAWYLARHPDLSFIACTIGEMGNASALADKAAMNHILLALPSKRASTACVDARDLKTHIGDSVHFDTPAQNEIGKRFAGKMSELHRKQGNARTEELRTK